MIEFKSPQAIEKMAVTGRFVAETLAELSGLVEPGREVMDLEHRARKLIEKRGAVSCYWDYAPSFGRGPFRNVICLSVNDAVLHGQPHPYVLRDGDVISLDFAVSIDGWVADSAVTVVAGTAAEEDVRLIDSTRAALDAAIAVAVPGNRIGDISAAVAAVGHAAGYRINTDFGGHGLGRTMHEDPHVANVGRPGRGLELRPGLTLALEPWWCAGTAELRVDPDGWTLRSADGSRGAHSEHTVAITEDGPRVLTARS
ncbi:type I methionyl aminopeptidase [Kitasatospora sp. NPDC059795]|uniref:type I methionyl aminopeptidase n=1 Tax=Kitasatospora sp. NPDC059795 TaxID=3346949 RepID=UPI00365E8629